MKTSIRLILVSVLAFLAACSPATQSSPPSTATLPPSETPAPPVRFTFPQDGGTLPIEQMDFQIEPVPGADGYALVFFQDGRQLWDTLKDDARLIGTEYSIPVSGTLNSLFGPGEYQVLPKARIGGVWTEGVMITIHLPERVPTSTSTPLPTATLPPPATGQVEIRWYVGMGGGTTANQQAVERNIVYKFNATHPNIKLTLQVVENMVRARELLTEQFQARTGPDIVGPIGFYGSNVFPDQWFDLSALVADSQVDLLAFQPELLAMVQADGKLEGLPLGVYPAVIFYNKLLFDNAGLAYPPEAYGKTYRMPDGSEAEWNWDTLAQLARLLTLDAQGRNATQPDFDAAHIVQYGFNPQYECPTCFASFWEANRLYDDQRNAAIPPAWIKAWEWYHDGMWGSRPFIPNAPALNTSRFGYSNAFSTSYCAMALSQSWYMGPNLAGGQHWDFAALPSTDGIIHGRIDSDTFRIWKYAPHPREAFEVLKYLLGPAYRDLIRTYASIPAITAEQDIFFQEQDQKYPWVSHWDVLKAGLEYPDVPSGEGTMPNFLEGWNRMTAFGDLLVSNGTISVTAEIVTLRRDLDAIFK